MAFQKLSPDQIRKHKGISFPGISTAFFCYDGKGKIVFAKRGKNARDEQGCWDCGAGGLKYGYSIEENVRREVKEEYGADVQELEFIGYFDAFRTSSEGLPTHWVVFCFAVKVDPEQVKLNEPDVFDDIGWFTLDNLPSPMHSQFSVFMAKYEETLRRIVLA